MCASLRLAFALAAIVAFAPTHRASAQIIWPAANYTINASLSLYFIPVYADIQVRDVVSINTANSYDIRASIVTTAGVNLEISLPVNQPPYMLITGSVKRSTADMMVQALEEWRTHKSAYSTLTLKRFAKYGFNSFWNAQSGSTLLLTANNPYQPPMMSGLHGGIAEVQVQDGGNVFGWIKIKRDDGRITTCYLLRSAGTYDSIAMQPMTVTSANDFLAHAFDGVNQPFMIVHMAERISDPNQVFEVGSYVAYSISWADY